MPFQLEYVTDIYPGESLESLRFLRDPKILERWEEKIKGRKIRGEGDGEGDEDCVDEERHRQRKRRRCMVGDLSVVGCSMPWL